ncbi:unnamed protein product, partial [Amoebophrya sp. A25]
QQGTTERSNDETTPSKDTPSKDTDNDKSGNVFYSQIKRTWQTMRKAADELMPSWSDPTLMAKDLEDPTIRRYFDYIVEIRNALTNSLHQIAPALDLHGLLGVSPTVESFRDVFGLVTDAASVTTETLFRRLRFRLTGHIAAGTETAFWGSQSEHFKQAWRSFITGTQEDWDTLVWKGTWRDPTNRMIHSLMKMFAWYISDAQRDPTRVFGTDFFTNFELPIARALEEAQREQQGNMPKLKEIEIRRSVVLKQLKKIFSFQSAIKRDLLRAGTELLPVKEQFSDDAATTFPVLDRIFGAHDVADENGLLFYTESVLFRNRWLEIAEAASDVFLRAAPFRLDFNFGNAMLSHAWM